MRAWADAGTSMASHFPGFLGSGWVRPSTGSIDWHMLYRFDGPESLATWQQSMERNRWLTAGSNLVEDTRVEHRTGIEGWFDEPTEREVDDLAPAAPPAPPRWKQMVIIFMGFFPLSLTINYVVSQTPLADWPLPLRVLVSIVVLTPVMTYALLPWITRRMSWWLHP